MGYKFVDGNELKDGVRLWSSDPKQALEKYGHISTWDTSEISDMSELFKGNETFDDDICMLFV